MTGIVFDTSVAIAILREEPGHKEAERLLGQALISTVNLAEIASFLARSDSSLELIRSVISRFPFQIIPLSQEIAQLAGSLLQHTKKYGISLGDRACLALAISRNLPVLTVDKVWKQLELPIEVKLLR